MIPVRFLPEIEPELVNRLSALLPGRLHGQPAMASCDRGHRCHPIQKELPAEERSFPKPATDSGIARCRQLTAAMEVVSESLEESPLAC